MIVSDLFGEIYTHLVEYWREKIEKEDRFGYIEKESELKAQLNEKLDDETKKLVNLYGLIIVDKMDNIHYEICNRLFNFCIKAGMDLQKAFNESE